MKNATASGLSPVPQMPLITGIFADFLEQLISLENSTSYISKTKDKPKEILDICKNIEKYILRGSIISSGDSHILKYPEFSYQPNGWSNDNILKLNNASSMVSEIAP